MHQLATYETVSRFLVRADSCSCLTGFMIPWFMISEQVVSLWENVLFSMATGVSALIPPLGFVVRFPDRFYVASCQERLFWQPFPPKKEKKEMCWFMWVKFQWSDKRCYVFVRFWKWKSWYVFNFLLFPFRRIRVKLTLKYRPTRESNPGLLSARWQCWTAKPPRVVLHSIGD